MIIKPFSFKIPVLVGSLLLLSACNKNETLLSGVIQKNMDTLVKPGDNFDAYVNGTWVKLNQLPADKAS